MIGQYAKGILNASSGARKAIIDDPLVLFQRCCIERLHHPLLRANALSPIMKCGMGRSSPVRGSCCGISMKLVMNASRNVDSFHSWASDAVPGAPTWTHVNLQFATTSARSTMVPRIVVELGPSIGRTQYANVFAIQGENSIGWSSLQQSPSTLQLS